MAQDRLVNWFTFDKVPPENLKSFCLGIITFDK